MFQNGQKHFKNLAVVQFWTLCIKGLISKQNQTPKLIQKC